MIQKRVLASNYKRMALVFLLLVLIAGTSPEMVSAHASTAQDGLPIAAGNWEGYLDRTLNASNSVIGVTVTAEESFNGPIVLHVGSGGDLSGTVGPVDIDFVYTVTGAGGAGGSCDGQSTFDIVGGGAAAGAGGLPVLTLVLEPTSTSFGCTFDIGGETFKRTLLTLQATTDSGVMLTGDTLVFDNEWIDFAVDSMRQAGAAVTVTEYWELVNTAPVVEVVTPEYEYIFLEGVSCQNTYEAIVNWNDNEPGKVAFTLAGDSREVAAADALVAQAMDMGGPPAGTNPLEVIAYTADGTPSAPHTVDVQIAALEPWAREAGFHVHGPSGGFPSGVIYAGTAHVPPEPLKLPYVDFSDIPLVGGKWGVPPIRLDVNLLATSLGGISEEAPIEGDVSLALGSDARTHRLQIDGGARTNLTPEVLRFHQGTATFELETVTVEKRVSAVDLVPGLGQLRGRPVIGELIKVIDSISGATGRIDASLSGEADLGPNDTGSQLKFTRGHLVPQAYVSVEVYQHLGIAQVSVAGGGLATFSPLPDEPRPEKTYPDSMQVKAEEINYAV